ncbi:MAG: Uma2 family endonuclease [Pyrinomonadaceae bacterium]|nr:Uma2 family endonuclease [Phycisphaerales bacterium]
MSAALKWPPGTGLAGLRMTADEYLALGETQERYELLDGVVFMSPSPMPPHLEIAIEVLGQFRDFNKQAKRCRVLAEGDLRLTPGLVYRPDIVVYRPGRLPTGRLQRLDLPPDLIIEILSPSTKPYDLITKRGDYGQFGVGEYWVIDPDDASLRCWNRSGGGWNEIPVQGDALPSTAIAGFVLEMPPLRQIARGEQP